MHDRQSARRLNQVAEEKFNQPMDPGHVDFALLVSDGLDQNESIVSNAMPVSKGWGYGLTVIGLVILLIGLSALSNDSVKLTTDSVMANKAIGVGLIILGSVTVAMSVRAFLIFLREVLELTD